MSGFSFGGHVKAAPQIRPLLNIGCLMDIPTGQYVKGAHGESILNGGQALITGLGGRGNTYKSTVAHHIQLVILARYASSVENIYDTEMSLGEARIKALSKELPTLQEQDLIGSGRLVISDSTVMSGNVWFDSIKAYCTAKVAASKDTLFTTPFIDREGKNIKAFVPSLAMADSMSRMNIDSVDAILDKNSVGDSGNNIEALKASSAKNQMLIQLPVLTAESGLYATFTAHVDDDIKIDPYAPATKKLSFLKGGLKFKYVSNQFSFLMNNLWYCFDAAPLKNQTTKATEYPRNSTDTDKANNDLMAVTIQNLRGKYGPSGMPFELLVSQSEGVLVGLSEFHYLKQYDRFGLGGSLQNYYLDLLPDVGLTRTTIRTKISSQPKLKRALEITSELCQMYNLWHNLPEKLLKLPKDIYSILKERGYDWDILLGKTRGYWIFIEDETEEPLYFLSSMDILNMCLEKDDPKYYHPWWYDEVAKK